MRNVLMSLIRLTAAVLVLAWLVPTAIIGPQPILADGGCSAQEEYGCINTANAHEDYFCSVGDCVTCIAMEGRICDGYGHELMQYWPAE